jgi:basic membrane lipoprotein Med (substrate-binding protein (PBP1-ABC) superfamily)
VALVIDDGEGGDFGFNEQEAELMKNSVEQFCKEHKQELEQLHQQYDNHKPEPFFAFVEGGEVGDDADGKSSNDDDFGID